MMLEIPNWILAGKVVPLFCKTVKYHSEIESTLALSTLGMFANSAYLKNSLQTVETWYDMFNMRVSGFECPLWV